MRGTEDESCQLGRGEEDWHQAPSTRKLRKSIHALMSRNARRKTRRESGVLNETSFNERQIGQLGKRGVRLHDEKGHQFQEMRENDNHIIPSSPKAESNCQHSERFQQS